MEAGDLNRRITIQKPGAADPYGQSSDWEVALPPVWANVRPISARELLRSGAPAGQISHTVAIRYRKELEPIIEMAGLRILYGTRILNIVGARDLDDGREWIVMECLEGTIHGN